MGWLVDLWLSLKARAGLMSDLSVRGARAEVSGGRAVLKGAAPDERSREEAERIALRHGARQVVNALVLSDPSPEGGVAIPSDFPRLVGAAGSPPPPPLPMEDKVAAVLAGDPRVNAHLVKVRAEGGVVRLGGRQDTVDASRAASETASRVPGVTEVVNRIEILPSV